MADWRQVWSKVDDPAERERRRVSLAKRRAEASAATVAALIAMPLSEREQAVLRPDVRAKLTDEDLGAVHASMMRDAVRDDRLKAVVGSVRGAVTGWKRRAGGSAASGWLRLRQAISGGVEPRFEFDWSMLTLPSVLADIARYSVGFSVGTGSYILAKAFGIGFGWDAAFCAVVVSAVGFAGWCRCHGFGLRHAAIPLGVAYSLAERGWAAWLRTYERAAAIDPSLAAVPFPLSAAKAAWVGLVDWGPLVGWGVFWAVAAAWALLGLRRLSAFVGMRG